MCTEDEHWRGPRTAGQLLVRCGSTGDAGGFATSAGGVATRRCLQAPSFSAHHSAQAAAALPQTAYATRNSYLYRLLPASSANRNSPPSGRVRKAKRWLSVGDVSLGPPCCPDNRTPQGRAEAKVGPGGREFGRREWDPSTRGGSASAAVERCERRTLANWAGPGRGCVSGAAVGAVRPGPPQPPLFTTQPGTGLGLLVCPRPVAGEGPGCRGAAERTGRLQTLPSAPSEASSASPACAQSYCKKLASSSPRAGTAFRSNNLPLLEKEKESET